MVAVQNDQDFSCNKSPLQFFTWNEDNSACGLRNFPPIGARLVSAQGQQTGTDQFIVPEDDVVFVARAVEADDAEECQERCEVRVE